MTVFNERTHNNLGLHFLCSRLFFGSVAAVNVDNLFRARICGTGQLLQITPPTFLCELSNKIDQTLQWIESSSNEFNRAQISMFRFFTIKSQNFGRRDLKASKRGLISGSDEGSRRSLLRGGRGNYVGTLGISKPALAWWKAHVGQTAHNRGQEQGPTGPNMWIQTGTFAILPKYTQCDVKLPCLWFNDWTLTYLIILKGSHN